MTSSTTIVPPHQTPAVGGLRRCADTVCSGVAIAAATLYVRGVDPSAGGWFPSCPTRVLTGVWCPGCGMTRAAHHLLNGDVALALSFNVFVVPVVVALAVVWAAWAVRRAVPNVRLRRLPGRATGRPMVVAYILAVVAFTVLRNLPGLGVLRGLGA